MRTNKSPQVSVVMPCYNSSATLGRAIDSILSQSFSDFELILTDDGSNDNTLDIIKEYAKHDNRISFYAIAHQGVVAAANFAAEQSSGYLIARMDSDDFMHPERLELQKAEFNKDSDLGLLGTQVRAVENSACNVLFSYYRTDDISFEKNSPAADTDFFSIISAGAKNKISDGLNRYIEWQNSCLTHDQISDGLYFELSIANPTIMIRRNIWQKSGGYRAGDFPEDYEFLFRLNRLGVRMRKLPIILHDWTDSDSRLTRTDKRYSQDAFDSVRYKYLSDDPRVCLHDRNHSRKLVFWGAGKNTRRRSDLLIAYGIQPDIYIDVDPAKIGKAYSGIPVYEPEILNNKAKEFFVLDFVRNHGAKNQIHKFLKAAGFIPGRDYLSVG
jgi:glycosyltransferase involved in cell wall biosynthesis